MFLNGLEPTGFPWIRKQHAQLASKMRFMAAQTIALLDGDLWQRNAANANARAQELAAAAAAVPGVQITRTVEANAVFAIMPEGVADVLRAETPFYTWDAATGEERWMCSWDTTAEDIASFVGALRRACSAAAV